ncbi:Homeobox domain-containing protein [Abeliophyllum distichum]|uniref:Protein WUSCHEL n=1 Tax=Abeliophyllum distichum TaxID=126358 RepID=A0ABD1PVA5_9LAMI
MASSNRHWPSMFKSKPQWQHDINSSLISTSCHRTPYTSVPECEDRTPDPKPRWNPRPEQIRILEAIFNSGMVNPPRDEIRKIRAQLQQYGQVGDANVFYWFQNRKSRSKQKNRQLRHTKSQTHQYAPPVTTTTSIPPLYSSSFDKSSPSSTENVISTTLIDVSNSPTASTNQSFFQTPSEFLAEPYFFPVQQPSEGPSTAAFTQGFCFPDVPDPVADHTVGNCCSSLLHSELMLMNHEPSKKANQDDHDEKMKLQQQLSYSVTTAPNSTNAINVVPPTLCVPSPMNHIQGVGVGESGGGGSHKVNVLIHSSGQPVLTNEWGVTLEPLQHGAFYYLVRPFTPSPVDDRTIELETTISWLISFVKQIAYFVMLSHGFCSSSNSAAVPVTIFFLNDSNNGKFFLLLYIYTLLV